MPEFIVDGGTPEFNKKLAKVIEDKTGVPFKAAKVKKTTRAKKPDKKVKPPLKWYTLTLTVEAHADATTDDVEQEIINRLDHFRYGERTIERTWDVDNAAFADKPILYDSTTPTARERDA